MHRESSDSPRVQEECTIQKAVSLSSERRSMVSCSLSCLHDFNAGVCRPKW
ncbi:hypothetical protein FQN60_013645 [Etheostoma spectabile]|uniref:Uncharacterized protein n=1 Tax=Etheostoma spectabile TaxID=54343 RepID=A0A5J5CG39_9PERO|nr:hypothetical protein FQN60_013645 [Etheostoma spectabile]